MKNKVNVNILIPALETEYNLFLPINKSMLEVVVLVLKAVSDITEGFYKISDQVVAINAKTGEMVNLNLTVKENNIVNGSLLIIN